MPLYLPSVPCPERPRVVVIFHSGDVTGPLRTLEPRLRLLSRHAELYVALPWEGAASAGLHVDLSRVVVPYTPLTAPESLAAMATLPWRLIRQVGTFRRLIRELRPALVVVVTAYLPSAVVASRIEGVPTIVYAAEILAGRRGLRRLVQAGLATAVDQLAHSVIACSEVVARQYGRATVIYPGIDEEPTLPGREKSEQEGPVLAALGNLTQGRGQDVLLRAVALLQKTLPGTTCVLAGAPHPRAVDVSFAAELAVLADTLGIADRVEFRGFVEDPRSVFEEADIVVNPARIPEAFGRVAAEALVAGRPVVASRLGAVPEVLRDGKDALLVPPDDPRALADAIERVWSDAALRSRLVESGRHRVLTEFNVAPGADRFVRIALDVAAPGSRAARRR